MDRRLEVAVLGMGMGGLAVATLLARAGHKVVVYDRMTRPGPVGSGFVLQPTGIEVLRRMGLEEQARRRGAPITRMLGISAPSGRTVLDVGYADGAEGLAIQRRALFDILLAAARSAGADFRLGCPVMGYDMADRPRPVLESMRMQPSFDLLIDAMGSKSPDLERSRQIGYGALWATVPWSTTAGFHHATLEQRYRRASSMAGVLPVGTSAPDEAAMATVFWSVRHGTDHSGWKRDAARLWPEMEPLLTHANPVLATYRHHTVNPRPHPRVLRIGDAWHATSPQLGQGANMALLDAISLDHALRLSKTIGQALAAHVARRRFHVALYQGLSMVLTPFYQSDGRLLPAIRDGIVAPMLSRRGLVHAIVRATVCGGLIDPLRRISAEMAPDARHAEHMTEETAQCS